MAASSPPARKGVVDPLSIISSVLLADRAQSAAAATLTPQQRRHTPAGSSTWTARAGGRSVSPRNPGAHATQLSPGGMDDRTTTLDLLSRHRPEEGALPLSAPLSQSPAPPPPPRLLALPSSRASGELRRLEQISRRRRGAALRAGVSGTDPSAPLWENDERPQVGETQVGKHTLNEIGRLKSGLHPPPVATPAAEKPGGNPEQVAAKLAESGQQLLEAHRELVDALRNKGHEGGVTPGPAQGGAVVGGEGVVSKPAALSPPVRVQPAFESAHLVPNGSPTGMREAAMRAAVQPVFLPPPPEVTAVHVPGTGPATTPGLPGWPSPQRLVMSPQGVTPGMITPSPQGMWHQHPQPQGAWHPSQAQPQAQPEMQPQGRRGQKEAMFGSEASRRRLPVSPWDQTTQAVNERINAKPWVAPQYGKAWQVFSQLFTSRGIRVDRGGPPWSELAPVLVDESLLAATATLMRGAYFVRFVDAPRAHAAGERFFYIATGGDAGRPEPELFWVSAHQRRNEARGAQNRLRLSSVVRVTAGPDDSYVLSNNLIVGSAGGEVLAGPQEKLGRPLELNPAGSLTLHLRDGRSVDLCATSPAVYKDAARVFTAVVEANARAEVLRSRGGAPPVMRPTHAQFGGPGPVANAFD
eukprot:Hpha_TRINITY_DN10916_c0_g1::TRINITY_DN10916_c0_g1_i1::g.26767::m.26767